MVKLSKVGALVATLAIAAAAFPAATRSELSQLLAVLASPPGRYALAGLTERWGQVAGQVDVRSPFGLQHLSRLVLRHHRPGSG